MLTSDSCEEAEASTHVLVLPKMQSGGLNFVVLPHKNKNKTQQHNPTLSTLQCKTYSQIWQRLEKWWAGHHIPDTYLGRQLSQHCLPGPFLRTGI